jgi:hypothetical protein
MTSSPNSSGSLLTAPYELVAEPRGTPSLSWGYGAVAALHDLVSDGASVFHEIPDDPHLVPYLRVLLGVQMAVRFFGAGPWDHLAWA